MSRLQKLSPVLSLVALAVAVGTAIATTFGKPEAWTEYVGSGKTASSPLVHSDLTRVMFPVQPPGDFAYSNNMISLAHNWAWDASAGWTRDDPSRPSVALTLESFYNELAELNFDMRPPSSDQSWPGGRAMGFAARHDGSYSTLTLGGQPYNAGSAGVKLTGGTRGDPVIAVFEGKGGEGAEALRVIRADGAASLKLQGGAHPGVSFGADVDLRRAGPGRLETGGELAVASLRIGNGDALQNVRLLHLELKPARLAAQATRDDIVELRGASEHTLIFVNGPEQPPGVALAGARAAGEGRAALRFINTASAAAQPAAGRYTLLIVEPIVE